MEQTWKTVETDHYIFHFQSNGLADIEQNNIISLQESCFKEITEKMQVFPANKIIYWLCNTRKEVGKACGLGFESNGITFCAPNAPQIYAVYNEMKKCVGYHEDTHAIMCQYAMPISKAIEEGLAMYFDKAWWGISNELCTYVYLKDERYVSVERLISDNEYFYSVSDIVSYPILGAFTAYLIESYGIEKYKKLYQSREAMLEKFLTLYGQNISEIEVEYANSIKESVYTVEQIQKAKEKLYQK